MTQIRKIIRSTWRDDKLRDRVKRGSLSTWHSEILPDQTCLYATRAREWQARRRLGRVATRDARVSSGDREEGRRSRRAPPSRIESMARHHVSETRCITPNTWGNTRIRRAALTWVRELRAPTANDSPVLSTIRPPGGSILLIFNFLSSRELCLLTFMNFTNMRENSKRL